jgi:large subunit ribosomal protein L32
MHCRLFYYPLFTFAFFLELFYNLDPMVNHMRHTRSQTGQRRSHDALKTQNLGFCPKCGAAKPSHVMCPHCGFYASRNVIDLQSAALKKAERQKKRAASSQA